MDLQSELEKQINLTFDGEEYFSERSFIKRKKDQNSFITANILLMLQSSNIKLEETYNTINKAKQGFKKYKKGNLYYHWPISASYSKIQNSILSKFETLSLDPDADCSSIIEYALNNRNEELIKSVHRFQTNKNGFQKFKYQQEIYKNDRFFLTWFPQKVNRKSEEQIDLIVIAHILLYLLKYDPNNSDVQKHLEFFDRIIDSDLILKSAYNLAPYYPKPFLIILFLLRFFKLIKSEQSVEKLIDKIINIKGTTRIEQQILSLFTSNKKKRESKIAELLLEPEKNFPAVYHAPLFSFINKKKSTLHQPLFHMKFYSKAFYLAYFHFLLSNENK
jgi:hypothetical protein